MPREFVATAELGSGSGTSWLNLSRAPGLLVRCLCDVRGEVEHAFKHLLLDTLKLVTNRSFILNNFQTI